MDQQYVYYHDPSKLIPVQPHHLERPTMGNAVLIKYTITVLFGMVHECVYYYDDPWNLIPVQRHHPERLTMANVVLIIHSRTLPALYCII